MEDRQRQLRRAVIASAVGTAIEWYDFFLYGAATALVFPKKFFPGSDTYEGQLLSYATWFVGFASRPIGGVIFGHLGDRIGRKASLIATLLLMGIATIGIGLVPGYETIGIWGAVLLTFGRFLQGIGVGGEWGGSVLLAAEWSGKHQRGFVTSWPQWGAPAGLVLANLAFFVMTRVAPGPAFEDWGWRVPFLASIVLIGLGFWIRTTIGETPVFAKLRSEGRVATAPVVAAVRFYWPEVLLTALLRTGQQTPFYLFSVFVLSYGTEALGLSRNPLLLAVSLAATASMIAIPLWGHLSDRIGRRRLVAIGCLAMMGWAFVYYHLLDTGSLALVYLAIIVAQPLHDLQYAPQAAVISESFPSAVRYTGASLGYQLASLLNGLAPGIALWLFHRFHSSLPIAVYVAVGALVSLVSLWLLPDRSGKELEEH